MYKLIIAFLLVSVSPAMASERESDPIVLLAEKTIGTCLKKIVPNDTAWRLQDECWERWREMSNKYGAQGIVMLARESDPSVSELLVKEYLDKHKGQ